MPTSGNEILAPSTKFGKQPGLGHQPGSSVPGVNFLSCVRSSKSRTTRIPKRVNLLSLRCLSAQFLGIGLRHPGQAVLQVLVIPSSRDVGAPPVQQVPHDHGELDGLTEIFPG